MFFLLDNGQLSSNHFPQKYKLHTHLFGNQLAVGWCCKVLPPIENTSWLVAVAIYWILWKPHSSCMSDGQFIPRQLGDSGSSMHSLLNLYNFLETIQTFNHLPFPLKIFVQVSTLQQFTEFQPRMEASPYVKQTNMKENTMKHILNVQ